MKNKEEFEGGLYEKGREKKKKEKSDKNILKYLYEALMTAKNPQKQGRILKGGRNFLAGQNTYIPLQKCIAYRNYYTYFVKVTAFHQRMLLI